VGNGAVMTSFLVHVSHRHGRIDWPDVVAAGVAGAAIRAGEGEPVGYRFTDPKFETNAKAAAKAGLGLVGASHGLVGGRKDAIGRQVDLLLAALDHIDAARSWALLDAGVVQEVFALGLGPRFADIRVFHDRWYESTDRTLVVHIPRYAWQSYNCPDLSVLRCPLVTSDALGAGTVVLPSGYLRAGGDSAPAWAPYGYVEPAMWTFTYAARVAGIAPDLVDATAFRGGVDELAELLRGGL